jgi:hypothetical protein
LKHAVKGTYTIDTIANYRIPATELKKSYSRDQCCNPRTRLNFIFEDKAQMSANIAIPMSS